MKIIFLPKCTMSRLQPLDAGIIRVFKCKYRNLFMTYVVSQINKDRKVLEIIQDVNIGKAIHSLQVTWSNESTDTRVHCFQKCGFKNMWLTALAKTVKSMRNSMRNSQLFLTNFVMMLKTSQLKILLRLMTM